jgi:hypothetical protein
MSAQVTKMLGRFQKTGMKLFTESTKALDNPMVQYAIGAILVLYITFLESESESVLSLAMANPLGRLMVLLLLLLLVNVNVPLGILFAILIVMSCVNRENFESVPVHNFTMPSNPPASFEENGMEQAANAVSSGDGEENSFEESFLSNHGMSPELMVDNTMEPANGTTVNENDGSGEVEGFTSETPHSFI